MDEKKAQTGAAAGAPSEPVSESRFALTKIQQVTALNRYRSGKDVASTYRHLWPSQPPMTLGQFVHVYHALLVDYMNPIGSRRLASRTEDDARALAQIKELQQIIVEAAREIRDNPIVVEGGGDDGSKPYISDRMRVLPGLLTAMASLEKSRLQIDRARIEKAAALQSLLVSNADRDGDDFVDVPAEDEPEET